MPDSAEPRTSFSGRPVCRTISSARRTRAGFAKSTSASTSGSATSSAATFCSVAHRFDLIPQGRIGADTAKVPAFLQRFHVHAGAADNQRALAPFTNSFDRLASRFHELSRRKGLVGITEIKQVVTDLRSLGGGRFGGPDIHAPVDLPRISHDDLGIEEPGQMQRDRGFSHRGRSGYQINGQRLCNHQAVTASFSFSSSLSLLPPLPLSFSASTFISWYSSALS